MSKAKDIVSQFKGFLDKYAGEALAVSEAFVTLLDGVALNSKDAAKVKAAIDKLQAAAESIGNAPEPVKIVINKADIDAAVAKALPKLVEAAVAEVLPEMVEAAVTKALTQ